jgi:adenylate kinase
MKTILFQGAPGAGKDTQVEKLVNDFNFENISTGDMFREMYSQGNIDAIKAHEYFSKGKWVPNQLTYKMLQEWVKNFNKEKNWAFVAVVRDQEQIALFDNLLKKLDRELDAVVNFKLSEEKAIERLSLRWTCPHCGATYHEKYKQESVKGYCDKCGTKLTQRVDDRPERIKVRMREHERTVDPILKHYKQEGLLIEIDASPSIDEIHKEVVKQLNLNGN